MLDVVDSLSPPHTAEYISAQHALTQDCATLQRIDKEIEACRLQMRLLERQRSTIKHRVSIHRARLSPLRTIPDQILQEIFQRCLPNTPYVVPSTHTAPLVLTHVCRRWRTVAHGTSELWSALALHDRGVWNNELELTMLTRWLAHTHARPLRLCITTAPCTDFGGDPARSGIFQLARTHAPHLAVLAAHVPRVYLERLLAEGLSALTSAAIVLHPGGDAERVHVCAPRLRHLALRGTQRVPRALLGGITHLALDGPPEPHVLGECRCLTHLAVALPACAAWAPQLGVVETLRTLEIRLDEETLQFGDPEWLAVLDGLEMPVLERLVVAVPPGADADAWVHSPSIAGLLSRCGARLEEWVLGDGFENWALF